MAIHSNERLPVQQEQVLRTVKMRNEKSKEVRGTRSSEEGQRTLPNLPALLAANGLNSKPKRDV